MYFYFYDKFAQDAKYQSVLGKIETQLIDLGINGRIEKLSIFKNAKGLVEDAIRHGAKTVVAVGDDKTFASIVNIVAGCNVVVGFIPLVEGCQFADILGIPTAEAACQVISRRLCTTLDVGRIGEQYFLGSAQIHTNSSPLTLRCDNMYTVKTHAETTSIQIRNLGDILNTSAVTLANPNDGKFELVISPVHARKGFSFKKNTPEQPSVFFTRTVEISSPHEQATIILDTISTVNTPCIIELVPAALKVIVGRERKIVPTDTPQQL